MILLSSPAVVNISCFSTNRGWKIMTLFLNWNLAFFSVVQVMAAKWLQSDLLLLHKSFSFRWTSDRIHFFLFFFFTWFHFVVKLNSGVFGCADDSEWVTIIIKKVNSYWKIDISKTFTWKHEVYVTLTWLWLWLYVTLCDFWNMHICIFGTFYLTVKRSKTSQICGIWDIYFPFNLIFCIACVLHVHLHRKKI